MEPKIVKRLPRKIKGLNWEMFIKIYEEVKINLWLFFFRVLEWITGSSKNKERHCTTGIGFS
jgi:hypothetical protein